MAIGFIPLIMIILLIAVGIGAAIYAIYHRKINKALEEGESTAHIGVPDPSTSSRSIATVVIIILLVVLLISQNNRITALQNGIESIQNNLQSNTMQMSDSMDELRRELSSENHRLMSLGYEVIGFNSETSKYIIEYTASLKQLGPDTKLTLYMPCGGRIDMVRGSDYSFKGIAECALWGDSVYSEPYVVIEEGDVILTEEIIYGTGLDYPTSLIDTLYRTNIFLEEEPKIHSNSFDFTCCRINIWSNWYDFDPVVSARLILTVNDNEISTLDCTQEFTNEEEIVINLENTDLKGKFNKGDKVEFAAEIKTANGFTVKCLIVDIENTKESVMSYQRYWGDVISVSRNGEELYRVWIE